MSSRSESDDCARRNFLQLGGMALAHGAELRDCRLPLRPVRSQAATPGANADYTLRIAPVTVELDRSHIISTIGYNGTAPGPVLRMREGKTVTVEVINETDTPELVHWHGMLIPPEVDGTEEEGSPLVEPHGRRRFELTPGPAGSRWYHSHAMAMDDLHKGAYTGQFGFVYVDGGGDTGTIRPGAFSGDARLGAVLHRRTWTTMTTTRTTGRCWKSLQ